MSDSLTEYLGRGIDLFKVDLWSPPSKETVIDPAMLTTRLVNDPLREMGLTITYADSLLDIKQKEGLLAYQAFPRPWVRGERRWTTEETTTLDVITDTFRELSETVCEWCGGAGRWRSSRKLVLTLCDECDARFSDPPDTYKDKKRGPAA